MDEEVCRIPGRSASSGVTSVCMIDAVTPASASVATTPLARLAGGEAVDGEATMGKLLSDGVRRIGGDICIMHSKCIIHAICLMHMLWDDGRGRRHARSAPGGPA
ncbi:hypothetical protein GCM10009727_09270 [Actinomadura napierensis]|uniref:Uncharacterized protein n=1 Tax=Actinomadura napierensis TaxID=267854 RepID=A0ABN2Y777_9ACTN